jgi:hypothetical protein
VVAASHEQACGAANLRPSNWESKLREDCYRRRKLPVKRNAHRCGSGSEETMRRSFLRIRSAAQEDYRARFGS